FVGQTHLALETACIEVQIHALAHGSKFLGKQGSAIEGLIPNRRNEILRRIIRNDFGCVRNGEDQSFQTHAESESLGRWTIQFFRKSIIPSAPGDRILGTEPSRCDFEGCAGVVIEPPDESRVQPELDSTRPQIRLELVEVLPAAFAKMIRNRRQFGNYRLTRRDFTIEDS